MEKAKKVCIEVNVLEFITLRSIINSCYKTELQNYRLHGLEINREIASVQEQIESIYAKLAQEEREEWHKRVNSIDK